MRLVIEISEEDYNEVFKITDWQSFPKAYMDFDDHLCYAIANGTPIPEHHGRLVSAEQLKEELGDTNMDIFTNEVKEMIDNALTIITAWIPVSERLPEDIGCYLTTTMYDEVYCDYWTGSSFDRQEITIAWMPLPEPYKKEGDI